MWLPYFSPIFICSRVCYSPAYVFCNGGDPWSVPVIYGFYLLRRCLMVFLSSLSLSQTGLISTTAPSNTLRRWWTSSSAPCPAGEQSVTVLSSSVSVLKQHSPFYLNHQEDHRRIQTHYDGLLSVFIQRSRHLWANVAVSQKIIC